MYITTNHLKGWHNQLNKKAVGNKFRLYRLLCLLKAVVLNPQWRSPSLIKVVQYAEKQPQVMIFTGEYTSGRCTLEQFLVALMYVTPGLNGGF
ncbi:hypothetical protein T10_7507, partial [Trichinella papuae]